nr:hypothetical protein [Streptomyces antibioticus]
MSETLIIERTGTPIRDSAGSVVPGTKVQITVTGCGIISPYGVTVGSSSETHNASNTVDTDRVFVAPLGTDVRPDDVIIRGTERWSVTGRPMVLPLTSLARVEAPVEWVTG